MNLPFRLIVGNCKRDYCFSRENNFKVYKHPLINKPFPKASPIVISPKKMLQKTFYDKYQLYQYGIGIHDIEDYYYTFSFSINGKFNSLGGHIRDYEADYKKSAAENFWIIQSLSGVNYIDATFSQFVTMIDWETKSQYDFLNKTTFITQKPLVTIRLFQETPKDKSELDDFETDFLLVKNREKEQTNSHFPHYKYYIPQE